MLHAEEDGAEEREELAVRAEAVVHALGVRARVVAQARIEASEAQVLGVGAVLDGQERLIFRVEQEDEPQHDREHALIEMVAFGLERRPEPVDPVAHAITGGGGLEAGKEDLDGLEDLLGELLGDVSLPAPALGEQAFERVLGRGAVGPPRVQEQIERCEQRPAFGSAQVLDPKRQVCGRFADRRVDQPQVLAIEEQADRNADVAQKPLELGRGRVAPRAGRGLGLVEVDVGAGLGEIPQKREPGLCRGCVRWGGGRRGRRRFLEGSKRVVGDEGAAPEGKARLDLLPALGSVERELGRQLGARHEHTRLGIAEEVVEERFEAPDARGVAIELRRKSRGELCALVGGNLRVSEHGDTENEALDGLREAEPFLVEDDVAVFHVIDSGHATTRPTGVRRAMRTS
nr:hypothetical protein [Polyangium spumosum]